MPKRNAFTLDIVEDSTSARNKVMRVTTINRVTRLSTILKRNGRTHGKEKVRLTQNCKTSFQIQNPRKTLKGV